MNRVLPVSVVLACFVAAKPSWANQPDFRLQVVPANVYKVDDPGNTGTSSFVFDLAVMCPTDCALTPISASVEMFRRKQECEAVLLVRLNLKFVDRIYLLVRTFPTARET